MRTPVVVMIFNRPDAAAHVFEEVARARPGKLLVIADGPRAHVEGDAAKCEATRAIVDRFDWECEVLKNYSDVNLGVGLRPATGLRWVFEQVEEAIVLEDDCVPHETFFHYCEDMLEAYRFDERVMHIGGSNWNFGHAQRGYSYFFSCYCYSCGWATWRRAFRHYDPKIPLWPSLRDTLWLRDILDDPEAVDFWTRNFDELHTVGVENTGWDWPWLFACWVQRSLSILPTTNLISNIGFSADATHTHDPNDERAFIPTQPMTFPLRHPPYVMRDVAADRRIAEQVGVRHLPQDFYHRARRALLGTLPPPLRRSLVTLRTVTTAQSRPRD